jgi:hypothetical protein
MYMGLLCIFCLQVVLLDSTPDHAASYNALVESIRRNLLYNMLYHATVELFRWCCWTLLLITLHLEWRCILTI